MPNPILDLPLEQQFFLGLVVAGYVLFIGSLFAVWVYVNLGGESAPRDAVISAAVRPADAGADDLRQVA